MSILNQGALNKIKNINLLNLAETRKNLYSEEITYVPNQTIIYDTGIPYDAQDYAWTGFLKVEPSTTYVRNKVASGGTNAPKRVFFYDIDKNPCSVLHTGISEANDVATEFTTPADCVYIGAILKSGTNWDIRVGFNIHKKNTIESVVIESSAKGHLTGTHTFSKNYTCFTAINESKYAPVLFTVDSQTIRIEAGCSATISGIVSNVVNAIPIAGKPRVVVYATENPILLSAPSKELGGFSRHIDRHYHNDLEIVPYNIKCIRRNIFCGTDLKKISVSADSGITYTTYDHSATLNADENLAGANITYAGSLIILTNKGRLLRSGDLGATLVDVTPDGLTILPWMWRSFDESDTGVIMFAEYSATSPSHRIFKSVDDGLTWTPVLTKITAEARHFHSLSYNPFNKKWYATSGDSDSQTNWFVSGDSGDTWTTLALNNQLFRTLSTVFTPDGSVIWAVDSDWSFQGYWKAKLSDLEDAEQDHVAASSCILPLQSVGWGLEIYENYLIAFTQSGNKPWSSQAPAIYLSKDLGNSWTKILEWPLYSGYQTDGFRGCTGIDLDGNVYIKPVLNKMFGLTGLGNGYYGDVKIRL